VIMTGPMGFSGWDGQGTHEVRSVASIAKHPK
jgi:hypothetical protein